MGRDKCKCETCKWFEANRITNNYWCDGEEYQEKLKNRLMVLDCSSDDEKCHEFVCVESSKYVKSELPDGCIDGEVYENDNGYFEERFSFDFRADADKDKREWEKFAANEGAFSVGQYTTGECRKNAPNKRGKWPVVFDSDYCGEHTSC